MGKQNRTMFKSLLSIVITCLPIPKNIPIEVLNNCYKNLKRYINNGLRKHTLRFNKIETNEP